MIEKPKPIQPTDTPTDKAGGLWVCRSVIKPRITGRAGYVDSLRLGSYTLYHWTVGYGPYGIASTFTLNHN